MGDFFDEWDDFDGDGDYDIDDDLLAWGFYQHEQKEQEETWQRPASPARKTPTAASSGGSDTVMILVALGALICAFLACLSMS